MKFESKFGLEEVCELRFGGEFAKVITVSFSPDGVSYLCRLPNGSAVWAMEHELNGDPKFDQELGCYPEGEQG